jgi:pimeloyl-ACP methyl ester carboxylesterase
VNDKILQILKMGFLIVVGILLMWILIAPGCMTFRLSDEKAQSMFARKGLDLKTETIKVNGKDIHYAMVGNDSLPSLVFLHGSPSAWNAFLSYMQDPELLFHFRMVSIDRPGFGYSDFGYALPLEEQSKMLMPVFNEINNGKAVYLAGHSLGGPLVVKMAADAPELFAGIMLISGSVDPDLEPKENWRFFMERMPFKYLLPGSFRPSNTELVYFKKDIISLVPDFTKVKCAVYLVHGDKDSWVPPGNVEFAKQKLVNASAVKVVMLPGGTHFIPWTRKKDITKAMVNMLTLNSEIVR